MKIWVDADACPVVIKEILFRAAERCSVEVILVANQAVRVPPSKFIRAIRVAAGFDVADHEIVQRVEAGDLVVTGDIPLAAEVLDKGAMALGFRGDVFSTETIRAQLTMRDFMETMRSSGIQTGGPSALGQADRQAFANALDRYLTHRIKV